MSEPNNKFQQAPAIRSEQFYGDIVWDSVSMAFKDEDRILYQRYANMHFLQSLQKTKKFLLKITNLFPDLIFGLRCCLHP